MHDPDFPALKRRLLRGGVAPKHANRTIRELRHHYEDLQLKAREAGKSPGEAAVSAAERLGNHELIIEEALARPELKSWSHRWPWGIYGLLPVVGLLLVVAGSIFGFVSLLEFAENRSGLSSPAFAQAMFDRWWVRSVLTGWQLTVVYVLPILFAGALCVFAARRDARIVWPTIGVFLVLFLGFSCTLTITPPAGPNEMASVSAGVGFGPGMLMSLRVFRLLIPMALVLGPYLWWRRMQQENLPA